jgi:hypothetical protein
MFWSPTGCGGDRRPTGETALNSTAQGAVRQAADLIDQSVEQAEVLQLDAHALALQARLVE